MDHQQWSYEREIYAIAKYLENENNFVLSHMDDELHWEIMLRLNFLKLQLRSSSRLKRFNQRETRSELLNKSHLEKHFEFNLNLSLVYKSNY